MGTQEILIILVVILLLFGATKLPTLARSAGQSLRIFKSEMNEMKKDGTPTAVESTTAESTPADPTVVDGEDLGNKNGNKNEA
ncbi:Sec-independent protein translocase subunit TatA [Corynebacterium sp. AOP40-9SA-29]|uniref:Sec-independent protein translocase subunit TatA n=1 Tax=Corynebacterium sp. AOP40-9SA-29 TaxID=3457677 RepID=UPI0040341B1E